ncbi:MAG: hypothetical protein AAGA77_24020, partial [Bacteroidota bacterium]
NVQLKKIPKSAFFESNDPVLLLSGAGVSEPIPIDHTLACSYLPINPHGTTVKYEGKDVPTSAAALLTEGVNINKPEGEISQENLSQNDLIAASQVWDKQPWQPIFLEWEINYFPINYTDGTTESDQYWAFNGKDYFLHQLPASELKSFTIDGRITLTKSAKLNHLNKLKEHIKKYPAHQQTLTNELKVAQSADFLSQNLDGIHQHLATLKTASNRIPFDKVARKAIDKAVAKALNFDLNQDWVHSYQAFPPIAYYTPEVNPQTNPSQFQFVKGGLFYFSKLAVIDRYGQVLDLIYSSNRSGQNTKVSSSLTPHKIPATMEYSYWVQTLPRINQAAKLHFNWAINTNHPNVRGIKLWVIHNFLNQSIVLYSPNGIYLGELLLQNSQLKWFGAPGQFSNYHQLQTDYPFAFGFIDGILSIQNNADAFNDLVKTIDTALQNIEPIGQAAHLPFQLIGRPLALTEVELKLDLQYAPNKNQSWKDTGKGPDPVYKEYQFPIKIGDSSNSQDGLIGYFDSSNHQINFSNFYTEVLSPDSRDHYIQKTQPTNYPKIQIGPTKKLALLIDPEVAIHVYSGLLPVQKAELDMDQLKGALDHLDYYFQVDATLGKTFSEVKNGSTEQLITIPKPAALFGHWSWLDKKDTQVNTWEDFEIVNLDNLPHLADNNNMIRAGFLKLKKS